jgi:hypothetical protein
MTQAQIPRVMRRHARSRRVNILKSLPLRVSEMQFSLHGSARLKTLPLLGRADQVIE